MVEDRVQSSEIRLDDLRFQDIWEHTPAMLHVTGRSGQIEAVSDLWLEKLGYQRDEVIGQHIAMFITEPWRSQTDHILAEVFATGVLRNARRNFVGKDGRVLEVLLSVYALRSRDGVVRKLLVALHDVTERNRAEREREAALAEVTRLKELLEAERDYLREEVAEEGSFGEIVGVSEGRQALIRSIEAVAGTGASVLIHGESGVGKELVARAIHAASRRAQGPLVKVNCASIPAELFESEFFGHVKGSFTGAHRDRVGRFELAAGGTLFLDEVGEVPVELQPKLLRVLQEHEFERVGDEQTRTTDARIIAATNRDLRVDCREGRFREDLYFRLSVFPIEVPPLRARKADIVPLAQHFLARHARSVCRQHLHLTQAQARQLERYHWPGNIRELDNVIERAVILSRGDHLALDEAMPGTGDGALPARVASAAAPAAAPPGSEKAPAFRTAAQMRALERENILAALEAADWKVSGKTGAAALLGMPATTLASRMNALKIERPRHQP